MICSLVTSLCIIGGAQIGPNTYQYDLLDRNNHTIHQIIVPMDPKKDVPQNLTEISEV